MYCKKCGKFLDSDAELCDDCYTQDVFSDFSDEKEKQEVVVAPTDNAPSSDFSLAKPIIATIFGNIGFWVVYFGITLIGELLAYELYTEIGLGVVISIIGAALCVVGLIFGIQAIKLFKTKASLGKRIPTLIMGIDAVAMSAFGILLALVILTTIMPLL